MSDPYKTPAVRPAASVSSLVAYGKRLAIAWTSSFVVVASYALALQMDSEISSDVLLAIALVASVTSLLAGSVAAAVFRSRPVVMVVATQLASIAAIAVVWAL